MFRMPSPALGERLLPKVLRRSRLFAFLSVLVAAGLPAGAQTLPIGTTSGVQTATVNVTAPGTLASVTVLTQGIAGLDFNAAGGGTCTVGNTYAAGDSCTVNFTFKPLHPGPRFGGVTLTTAANAVLGTAYLSGKGTGPAVSYPPVRSVIGNPVNYFFPSCLALDAANNVFTVDQDSSTVRETFAATNYTTNVQIAPAYFTKTNEPTCVAVDGAGNLWVTNQLKGQLVRLTLASGYTDATVIGSGFYYINGVTVDASGNVFVADEGHNVIKELTAASNYATITSYGSGFSSPWSVAVDSVGNLFVADTYHNLLKEIVAAGGYTTIKTLGTVNDVVGVAVDSSDNVYAVGELEDYVKEFTAASGYSSVVNLAQVIGTNPYFDVAVDSTGSLYLAQVSTGLLKFDAATPPTLSFTSTPVGVASANSPQTVTLTNSGNMPLIFDVPSTGSNPFLTAGFSLSGASTCPNLGTSSTGIALGVGASCTYAVNFIPVSVGVDTGVLQPSDDAYPKTQTIPLNGTGTAGAPVVTSITPNSGPAAGGTVVTLTGAGFANVTSVTFGGQAATYTVNSASQITATSPAKTGTVDVVVTTTAGSSATSAADRFTYSSVQSQSITFPQPAAAYAGTSATLAASSSSGLPITYSVVSGAAGLSGATLTYQAPGTVVVQADQPGDATHTAATPVQRTVTVTLLSQPLRTASAAVSTVVTFTATGTLSHIAALTNGALNLDFSLAPGGTCAVGTTYAVGQTCTLNFTFTPINAGLRNGGLTLLSSAGALLANSYVYGVGVGPQLVFSPAMQSSVAAGSVAASGVAVDSNGNMFVSDTKSAGIKEILPSGTVRTIGTFPDSEDIAVDGSGNVFVGYSHSSVAEILAVNGSIPATPTIRTLYTGLDGLNGLKVDGNGNVFVASTTISGGQSSLHEFVAVNGVIPATPQVISIQPSLFPSPTGIAPDMYGNLFVSDQARTSIYELQTVNGVVTTRAVGSGLGIPTNVFVDSNGNLFVTDSGAHAVRELLAVGGVVPASPTTLTVGSGLGSPQGIFVDSLGDLFIADNTLPGIVELSYGAPPTLAFAATAVGATSADSPKTVTFLNTGNAPLTYSAPLSGINPTITSGYVLASSSTCPQVAVGGSATLAAGASCTDAVSFVPVAVGPDPGTLVTTDNNLGFTAATQTVLLTGVGNGTAPTITFTVPNHVFGDAPFTVAASSNSPGAFTYSVVSGPATLAGNTVTLTGAGTVTLLASQAAAGAYTAGSATATFTVSKKPQTISFAVLNSPIQFTGNAIALSATATSGLPVTFSVLSGPARVSGSSLTLTGIGTIVIAADQPGDANYAPAAQVTQTLTVLGSPASISLSGSPNPVFLGNSVTLTATVAAPPLFPTGTVTFFEGLTPLATATLGNNGVATSSLTSLTLGSHTIYAQYNGDTSYSPATSAKVVIVVQDFALAVTNADAKIFHGGTASYTLQVNSVGGVGMASDIALTLTGAPDQSIVSFSPEVIAVNSGAQQVTLTIKTPNYPVGPWSSLATRQQVVLASMLFGALILLPFRRRAGRWILPVVLFAAALTLSGCGSGWRTQVWHMQAKASSGNLTHVVDLTLSSSCANGQERCAVEAVK